MKVNHMKIGILTENFLGGGLESNIETYANFLTKHHVEFVLITSTDQYVRNLYPKSSYVIIPQLKSFSASDTQIAVDSLTSLIKTLGITYLLVHPFLTFQTGVLAAIKTQTPFSLFFHGPGSIGEVYGKEFTGFLKSKALKNADYAFAVSREVKNMVIDKYGATNVILLPNPVTIHSVPLTRRKKMILLVSRLDSDKLESIFHALTFINSAQDLRDYQLLIAGEGDAAKQVARKVKQLHMKRVTLLGFTKNTEIVELTKQSSLTIGMGRVALEAMSTGTPVLLAGYDGLKGFITKNNIDQIAASNFSGRGIPNIEYSALFEQLPSVLTRSQKLTFSALRNHIREQYSIEVLGERLCYLINCNLP
jgi:glycosyltransferase involved in cell wall biosynthesis